MKIGSAGYARDLSGRVALVTGGGKGLGRAFAQALASAGAAVSVISRTAADVEETVRLISETGAEATGIPTDVTDLDAVTRAIEWTESQLGPVELLINNAGIIGPLGNEWEADPTAWWEVFQTNVLGPRLVAGAVLPGMVRRGT